MLSRRKLLELTGLSAGVKMVSPLPLFAKENELLRNPRPNTQGALFGPIRQINAGVLNVGFIEAGPPTGRPVIGVPTITIEGDANGAPHPDSAAYRKRFSGMYSHRVVTGRVGHNLPQEAPQAFAKAVIDVDGY